MDKMQVMMIPIKEIDRGRYNVLRSKDRNWQTWLIKDIDKRGLEKPIKVNKEKGKKPFASIDGEYRITSLEALHQKKRSVRCLQDGNWIPKGKIAAWVYTVTPQEAYMEAARSHFDRDFESAPELKILEFGGHFDRALQDVKYGSKGTTEAGIARDLGKDVTWVERCLSTWRNSSEQMKEHVRGIRHHSSRITSTHLIPLSRIKGPIMQSAAYEVADKMKLSVANTEDMCQALRVLEDNPLIAPLSPAEAKRIAQKIALKKPIAPPSAYFIDLMQTELLRAPFVSLRIQGLKCPDCGRVRRYIHCQSRIMTDEELKENPCELKDQDIKMDECGPDISLNARFLTAEDRDAFKNALDELDRKVEEIGRSTVKTPSI